MTARDVRYQAAVVDAGRLLLLRCVPHGEEGFWILPGGGREAGETETACVAREVREEAGVEVEVGPLLYEVPADPPDGTYTRWRTYLCRITAGEPVPGGGEGWADLTAVRWLPLAQPEHWESELRADPFLHPQLLRIAGALASHPTEIPDPMNPTSPANDPGAALRTERVLPASPREVFAAFEQPDRLARWWGPNGFTNTFERFEFWPGGRWVFAMHGPNGASYPNESVFREIRPDSRIVIEHVVKPWYRLTVTLAARDGRTHLAWVQEFESPEVAARMRPLSESANEQNLDRLEALLASEGS